ncbi:MAG: DUF4290 domain-containing protein [Prevotella sp.]|nr:DUF4290 domain-containing protein [Prevotella sp.]MDD5895032.1 DUF4290 domain-containing protein [Prevotellaceae bacterium]
MKIEGLDYNTKREDLVLPEYGREIQNMVDHAITLPDRNERLRCAKTIVKMMATKSPQILEDKEFEKTLWDHLYLIGRHKLDIDWPFDTTEAERILSKPDPMPIPGKGTSVKLRHYGRLVQELLEKLKAMQPGPERDQLTSLTANQMKRDLVNWGHGSMDNEKVADDLARLTDGIIQLDLQNFVFEKVQPLNGLQQNGRKKKKK